MASRTLASLAGTLVLAAAARAQMPPGVCVVNDSAFDTREGGCKDLVSKLVWSATAGSHTWDQANGYAAALVEGGYSDWRLPTLAELQAAYTRGGASHIAILGAGDVVSWSSTAAKKNTSPWNSEIWVMNWGNGQTFKVLKGSHLYYNCVRQGSSSFTSGGNDGPSAASGNRVTNLLQGGKWTAVVDLPEHARAPYTMLVVHDPKPVAPNLPLLRLAAGGLLGSARGSAVMASTGMLNESGRTSLVVDTCGLGLPASTVQELTILLLVGDLRLHDLVLYRVHLPR